MVRRLGEQDGSVFDTNVSEVRFVSNSLLSWSCVSLRLSDSPSLFQTSNRTVFSLSVLLSFRLQEPAVLLRTYLTDLP